MRFSWVRRSLPFFILPPPKYQAGIFECGFERPSPVQEEVIPLALANHDIIARAKNGTGKTAALSVPPFSAFDMNELIFSIV